MNDVIEVLKTFRPGPFEASPSSVQRSRTQLLEAMAKDSPHSEIAPVDPVSLAPDDHVHRVAQLGKGPKFLLAVATVAAALVVVGALVFVPSGGQSSAAAVALGKVAAAAAQQTPQVPGPDQYYFIEERVSIVETAHNPADNSTATATFIGTEKSWVSPDGSGEETQSWSVPTFASPTDEAAWNEMPGAAYDLGPQNGPVGVFFPGQLSGRAAMDTNGFLDVAALPTDEAGLSQEIDSGTTGIRSVDDISVGANTNFERVALLLAGPDIGATPAFTAALYQELSSLPGVTLLGPTASNSGQSGLGFEASETTSDPVTIVVNPRNGDFLELRYNDNNGPTPNGTFGGGSSTLTVTTSTQWMEPLQSSIVPLSSFPSVNGCTAPVSLSTCPLMAAAAAEAQKSARTQEGGGSTRK